MAKKKKQETSDKPKVFINPFTDFGFKKIFGEEPNKDLLIDFLNQLLLAQNVAIKDLTYKKTEHLGATDLDRKVVFDLYCENDKGEKFIVEMQKAKQSFFKDRTLFYSTFPIQEQAQKNDWNYELKSVFAVAILDFAFNDKDSDKTIVNRVQLLDKATCEVFYDKLTFIFVQMKNFNKGVDELKTRLDKWLYVLKNLDKFDRIPEKIKDKLFQKVFKIAEYHQLSKEERMAYEDSLKYYRDLKNSFDTARQEGYLEAEEALRPQIDEERRQREEAQKREADAQKREADARKREADARKREADARKREADAMRKLAKSMEKYGEPIEKIQKETGLSAEEIEKL